MKLAQLDINNYLNADEQKMLDYLNLKSNHLQKEIKTKENIFNMSINTIIYNWTIVSKQVIDDIFIFINNIDKYKNHFTDIDETKNWIDGISKITKEFLYIFIKNKRSIYVGITIIIVGLLIGIIQITS
jgi:hypothetical protein